MLEKIVSIIFFLQNLKSKLRFTPNDQCVLLVNINVINLEFNTFARNGNKRQQKDLFFQKIKILNKLLN